MEPCLEQAYIVAVDAVAAEGQERDPMWWLVIGGVIAVVASTVALWAWLPEPIAVRWEWGGEANNSMPRLGYILVWSGAWVLVSSALVSLRAPFDWRRWLVIAIAGVLIAGHITTLENNLGADSWQAAEPLDITSALALVILGSAAVWLVERRLQR